MNSTSMTQPMMTQPTTVQPTMTQSIEAAAPVSSLTEKNTSSPMSPLSLSPAAASPEGTPLHGATSAADDFLDWTRIVFGRISNRFDRAATTDLLAWAGQTFGTGLSIGTSFGASGIVLMDLALQLNPDVDIFYIDTGYFFPETLALMRRLETHYQRNFRRVSTQTTIAEQEKQFGPRLFESDPDLCCHVRKVLPMSAALTDSTAWATAVRRDQAPSRQNTPLVQWNERHNVVKLAPLAHWTEADVWEHIAEYNLPYNRLHDQNYPSVGCWPCTRAIQPGEDLRAGRWSGREKTECGIHWEQVPSVQVAA